MAWQQEPRPFLPWKEEDHEELDQCYLLFKQTIAWQCNVKDTRRFNKQMRYKQLCCIMEDHVDGRCGIRESNVVTPYVGPGRDCPIRGAGRGLGLPLPLHIKHKHQ